MNLLEYQLQDVRRAVKDYNNRDVGYERQALRTLVERIMEIVNNRPDEANAVVYRVLGPRGKYYPITEGNIKDSYTPDWENKGDRETMNDERAKLTLDRFSWGVSHPMRPITRDVIVILVYAVNLSDGITFTSEIEIPAEYEKGMSFKDGFDLMDRKMRAALDDLKQKVEGYYASRETSAAERENPVV